MYGALSALQSDLHSDFYYLQALALYFAFLLFFVIRLWLLIDTEL